MASTKRKDKSRVVLRVGELQRKDGTYQYSWIDKNKKRRYVYSKSLDICRYDPSDSKTVHMNFYCPTWSSCIKMGMLKLRATTGWQQSGHISGLRIVIFLYSQ